MELSQILKAAGLIGAGALAGYAFSRLGERPPFEPIPTPALTSSLPPFITINTNAICLKVATKAVAYLAQYPGQRVLLVLNTLGGSILPVVQVVRAVQRHGQVTAWVPFHALSGGTMIALACREIFMWPDASLGPVDPQIGSFSASALLAVRDAKPIGSVEDQTLALAHEAEKALEETTKITRSLVSDERAVSRLVAGKTPHSLPISYAEARDMGLRVQLAQQSPMMWALARRVLRGGECKCLG